MFLINTHRRRAYGEPGLFPMTDASDYEEAVAKYPRIVIGFCRHRIRRCREFVRLLQRSSKEHPDVRFLLVDVNRSPVIAARLKMRCIPAVMTIRDGNPKERRCGAPAAIVLDELVQDLSDPLVASGARSSTH